MTYGDYGYTYHPRIHAYTRMCENTVVETDGGTRARITDDTADRLHERKRRGESYNDVIVRLLDMADEMENDE